MPWRELWSRISGKDEMVLQGLPCQRLMRIWMAVLSLNEEQLEELGWNEADRRAVLRGLNVGSLHLVRAGQNPPPGAVPARLSAKEWLAIEQLMERLSAEQGLQDQITAVALLGQPYSGHGRS
jgi:hypothetical protein